MSASKKLIATALGSVVAMGLIAAPAGAADRLAGVVVAVLVDHQRGAVGVERKQLGPESASFTLAYFTNRVMTFNESTVLYNSDAGCFIFLGMVPNTT